MLHRRPSFADPSEPCRRPLGSDHYRSSSNRYIYMTTTTLLVTLNCPMALECGGIRSAGPAGRNMRQSRECHDVPGSAAGRSRRPQYAPVEGMP